MRKITITLDDETYRRAGLVAADRCTSVSALVRQFLASLAKSERENEQLKREERALRDQITTFRASGRLPREDIHERRR